MAEAAWRRYLRFWRSNVDADVDAELRFHFDERVEALMASGLPSEQALREAEREFGDLSDFRDGLRAIDRRVHAARRRRDRGEVWRQDVAYSGRRLLRAPGSSIVIIVTLALGIGINATLFSILDRVFLRMPAGIDRPEQVHRLYWTGRGMNNESIAIGQFSIPLADAVADAVHGTASTTVYRYDSRRVGDELEPSTMAAEVGSGYFQLLGVRPAFGRFFAADEERLEVQAPVAVVGETFWERRFGGSPADALGQTISLDKRRFTIIGVAPRDFTGPDLDAADVWIPLGALTGFETFDVQGSGTPWYRSRSRYGFIVLARTGPTVSDAPLEAAATIGVRRGFADDKWRSQSLALAGPLLAARGPEARGPEVAIAVRLGGVALIVLLIACANVANLLLARSVQRRREIAVRSALGISRGGIVRLFLAESVLLALAAGVAALIVSTWSAGLLRALLFPDVHWTAGVVDWRIAGFTLAVTLVTGIAAGVAPAVRASRTDVSQSLKTGGREGGAQRSRLRALLVMTQTTLSTMLLVGAALFVKSLHAVRGLDLGFDVQRLVFVSVHQDQRQAGSEHGLQDLATRIAHLPGVERVALSSIRPMYDIPFTELFYANGDSLPAWTDGAPGVTGVSPEFFAATGLRVLRGRGFTDHDRQTGVAVVNETLARSAWPQGDALGQCLRLDKPTGSCMTIIGIVEDARRARLIEKPVRQLYLPLPDSGGYSAGSIVVRVPPARAAAVEILARRETPRVFSGGEARVLRLAELLAPQYRPWQLGASLFSILGLLALVVAAIGVFSTLSHDISQRRHELGVRVALGAGIADIVRLVLENGVRLVIAGAVLGSLLSVLAGRLIASLLYGVAPRDPAVLATVVTVLLVVAIAASAAPAWRASRADPMDALRAD